MVVILLMIVMGRNDECGAGFEQKKNDTTSGEAIVLPSNNSVNELFKFVWVDTLFTLWEGGSSKQISMMKISIRITSIPPYGTSNVWCPLLCIYWSDMFRSW
mmetsp:Transcript_33289/g.37121  ORF Transcript_33289/g.37121 Transcript_33289/m.37121 type:complete len:102 (-) Transcript_33289:69-374(-)